MRMSVVRLGVRMLSVIFLSVVAVFELTAQAIDWGGGERSVAVEEPIVYGTTYKVPDNDANKTDLDGLGRGVLAVPDGQNGIFVSWRSLKLDADSLGFNLYRIVDGGVAEKLNDEVLERSNFYDSTANVASMNQYVVKTVLSGVEGEASPAVAAWSDQYLSIPLQVPAAGVTPAYYCDDNDFGPKAYTYNANDASVADLDGDGAYEIILKWDPDNSRDNSDCGFSGNTYYDAYKLDGTLLWRIDLGVNCRSGAHYSPFMVYDFDGDGKAELISRTASGTKDGAGAFLSKGPAAEADHNADYRNSNGYILTGPEYLTVFSGVDGSELETINLEPNRGDVNDWGDRYGNRVDRFLAAVAYLDGVKPSVVWARGIYAKTELAAYDWDGVNLTQKWFFTTTDEQNQDYASVGSHNLSVGDVDGDGKDEIVYGGCAIDHDGKGLWTLVPELGKGTGDAGHLADIIPERDGLEKFGIMEGESNPRSYLVDAATGEVIWKTAPGDQPRGVAADLVKESYGMECWGGTDGLRDGNFRRVSNNPGSANFVIWWDGDLGRETLNGNLIREFSFIENQDIDIFTAVGAVSNNSTKSTPSLQADLFGDWREEVIWRASDNSELRIYATVIPTEYTITTLMQERQYRLSIAWQNNSYNQPPHTAFYLGFDMFTPKELIPPSTPGGFEIEASVKGIAMNWGVNNESDLHSYSIYRADSTQVFELLADSVLVREFVDSAIVWDREYFYYVKAMDNDGNFSAPTSTLSGIPTFRPDPPSNVKVSVGETGAVVFWETSKSPDVVGYNVYMAESPGGDYIKLNDDIVTDSSYEHTGLTAGETYYFMVKTEDSKPAESFVSDEKMIVAGEYGVLQAEEAILENIFNDDNHEGFNGTGFANFDSQGKVTFKHVFSEDSGWFELITRHALEKDPRTGRLAVNDSVFSFTMSSTGAFTTYLETTIPVLLNAGFDNVIVFESIGGDFGNLDEIRIGEPTDPPAVDCLGEPNGSAVLDACGACIMGNSRYSVGCYSEIGTSVSLGLQFKHSGLCLNAGESLTQGACSELLWTFSAGDNAGYYKIRNAETNQYLNLRGINLEMVDAVGVDWRVEQIGEDFILVPSTNLGLVVGVRSQSTNEGDLVRLFGRSSDYEGMLLTISDEILSVDDHVFDVYPNPVDQKLMTIRLHEYRKNSFVKVVALDGRSVYVQDLLSKVNQLDLKSVAKGIYLVQVYEEGALSSQKKLIVR